LHWRAKAFLRQVFCVYPLGYSVLALAKSLSVFG
jgi:hypothetical protein